MARLYHCRQCRRLLFDEARLEDHSRSSNMKCTSVWLEEPEAWMGKVGAGRDKILCTCGAKLGASDWSGMRCSCGTWIAPGFHIALSRVDVKRSKKMIVSEIEASEEVLPSLHWLRLSPPPTVVIVAGPEPSNDQVRESISKCWAGRHLKDNRSAWLFVGSRASHLLDPLIHGVEHRSVLTQSIALGGIGLKAAIAAASAANHAFIPFLFVLSVPPDDSLWSALLQAADRDAKVLVVCTAQSTFHHHPNIDVTSLSRLDPGILTDAVVRTLCTWLSAHLSGFELLETGHTPDHDPDASLSHAAPITTR